MSELSVLEAVELRTRLEPVAAHGACARGIADADAQRLRGLLRRQRDTEASADFWELDRAFCRALGQAGAGPLLRGVLERAIDRSPVPADLDRSGWIQRQQALLDAVLARDGQRARSLCRRNVRLRFQGAYAGPASG